MNIRHTEVSISIAPPSPASRPSWPDRRGSGRPARPFLTDCPLSDPLRCPRLRGAGAPLPLPFPVSFFGSQVRHKPSRHIFTEVQGHLFSRFP